MNDERERRQTIYRLEFDFHAIDMGNKNRERIFSTNKPIGIITKG